VGDGLGAFFLQSGAAQLLPNLELNVHFSTGS